MKTFRPRRKLTDEPTKEEQALISTIAFDMLAEAAVTKEEADNEEQLYEEVCANLKIRTSSLEKKL